MKAVILIRILVGWVFISEGIQKFLFPNALGAGRFEAIGIPLPQFAAPFVGFVEIFCGALLIIGVFMRLAILPLLAVILTAIGTTKIPELWHVNQGVWFMLHDARTDFSMLLGLIFLLIAGPGPLSISGARQGIIDYRTSRDQDKAEEHEARTPKIL
ncbi:MAG: DoxX family protein [Acidobacteriaceae bacterium]|jgi:putative oxidoreductase